MGLGLVSLGIWQYRFSSETSFSEKGIQINLEIQGGTVHSVAPGCILCEGVRL